MLDDIAVFVAVARTGSFTAGAAALGISTSYASKRVRRLEAALGKRLLNRSTRALALTPEGQAYLSRCGPALDEIEAAGRTLVDPDDAPRGRLRVTVPLSFGPSMVAPVVADLLKRHPLLDVDIDYSDRTVDVVGEGYDLAIRAGSLPDSDLMARRIGSFCIHLVASPAYLARHGNPTTLAELTAHQALIYTLTRQGRRWEFPSADGSEAVAVSGRLSANNGDALTLAALEGLGIARQPDFMVEPFLQSGALVRVLPDLPSQVAPVWAVYPESRLLSPKVLRFIEALAAVLPA